MPVQPAVSKDDDSMAALYAQKFISAIKSRVGQSARVFTKSPQKEGSVPGEKGGRANTTPPDTGGPLDDLVRGAKL